MKYLNLGIPKIHHLIPYFMPMGMNTVMGRPVIWAMNGLVRNK
jgi:hypothetical protein